MRIDVRLGVAVTVPLLAACPVEQAAADYFAKWGDSGSSTGVPGTSTSGSGTTTASPTTGDMTYPDATGSSGTTESVDASTSGSSSTGGEAGEKGLPVHVELYASPSPVDEVGEVQLSVWTSRPVVSIDLYDNDKPLVLGAVPALPVHVFEVTSDDVPGDGTHTLRAVAHADDGVSGAAETDLLIDVQPGGTNVWPPYVQKGPINGFTSAALLGNGIAAAGFLETQQGIEAVAVRIDGVTGLPEGEPIMLGKVALASAGSGPAIAADDQGAVYVASTQPGWPTAAVTKVQLNEPLPIVWTWTGDIKTKAHAVAVAQDVVVVVGVFEMWPGKHDLKVWWLSAEEGELLHEAKFRAPPAEDPPNDRDEIGRGVAFVEDEVVVVGEREIKGADNEVYRRMVVLRYGLVGDVLGEWNSPGELTDEDGGMALAPLSAGGFVVTGWGRNIGFSGRLLLTRWFTAEGNADSARVEPTTSDAIGYAVQEDREGKIVIAGSIKQPATDADAWIFAIPGPLGPHAWEVVRDGPGHGPDNAAGVAVDPWGYAYVVGSEFEGLQPRAFALRLYP